MKVNPSKTPSNHVSVLTFHTFRLRKCHLCLATAAVTPGFHCQAQSFNSLHTTSIHRLVSSSITSARLNSQAKDGPPTNHQLTKTSLSAPSSRHEPPRVDSQHWTSHRDHSSAEDSLHAIPLIIPPD